jgi:hypothetical protein
VFEAATSALQRVLKQQVLSYIKEHGAEAAEAANLKHSLRDDKAYSEMFEAIKAELLAKGERSTIIDPQHNSMKDSYDRDEYVSIMEASMAAGTPEADRAVAMGTWAHSSVGRSDDVRLFYMADLIAPQYIPAVGRWTVLLW